MLDGGLLNFNTTILDTDGYRNALNITDNFLACGIPSSFILSSEGFFTEPLALYICSKIIDNTSNYKKVFNYLLKSPHSDFFPIKKRDNLNSISVADIRDIIDFFSKSSTGNRVTLICGAENMTYGASNALLKILEEPPTTGFIILETRNLRLLSNTVRSRCIKLDIPIYTKHEFNDSLIFFRNNIVESDSQILHDFFYPNLELAVKVFDEFRNNYKNSPLKQALESGFASVIDFISSSENNLLNDEKYAILYIMLHREFVLSSKKIEIENLDDIRNILLEYNNFSLDLESVLNCIRYKIRAH